MLVASLTDSNAVMVWTASDYYSIINAMLYQNPHQDICNKEIKVTGCWTYQAKDWLQAMEVLKEASKQGYPVGELVSHKFSLDDINEAMETNICMDRFKISVVG